jgi:cysteine desulfuration protein SufE
MTHGLAVTVEELFDTFEMLEDWDERYEYIIELGDQLPELPEEYRTREFKVEGCLSSVWLTPQVSERNGEKRIDFLADSDSLIVKGLVTLVLTIYSGRSPREILAVDINSIFDRLGLKKHLSGTRRNGLNAMVKRIRGVAERQLAES